MKIFTIVGARPQFIKAATVSRRLRSAEFRGLSEILVHTGQHYDDTMSKVFFEELDIPEPAHNLGVGSGTQAEQTAKSLTGLEPLLGDEAPDMVLVYGDTNATLAGALAAAKAGIPLAHVEAGLRSFRRGMPEEVNRVVADRLSELLFCPTATAVENLRAEGRNDGIHQVGDVMLDGFRFSQRRSNGTAVGRLGLEPGGYALATIHRAESTDDPERLQILVEGLSRFAKTVPVVLPLHPRTRAAADAVKLVLPHNLTVIDPVPYGDMVGLTTQAAVIATDSGGLQKEAAFARVPCVTLREETEWTETVASGWNRLPALEPGAIADAMRAALTPPGTPPPDYGDGDAAGRILSAMVQWAGDR